MHSAPQLDRMNPHTVPHTCAYNYSMRVENHAGGWLVCCSTSYPDILVPRRIVSSLSPRVYDNKSVQLLYDVGNQW